MPLPKWILNCKKCGGYRRKVGKQQKTLDVESQVLTVTTTFECWACGDQVQDVEHLERRRRPLLDQNQEAE